MRVFAVALLGLCLFGCTTHRVSDAQYLHSLTVGFAGEPFEILRAKGTSRVPDGPLDDFDQQLALIEEEIGKLQPKRIVVFVHGGMNTLSNGLDRTDDAVRAIECWNAKHPNESVYPIFINWHSRFVTFYDRHFRVRQGRISPKQAWVTWPFTLVADFGRALTRLPATITTEGQCAIGNIGRCVRESPRSWPNAKITRTYEIGGWAKTGSYVTQIVPGVLRIGTMFLTDAVLYESYQLMLRRIDMLFRTEADYAASAAGRDTKPSGAISKLMDRMPSIKKATGARIELIGHSLGSIAVNEIVRRYPKIHYDRIIYMAAACSGSDFMDTIPPYLESHSGRDGPQFFSLMLHPFADKDEAIAWSALPRGSLLEWLDNYALTIKTPLDRTIGKWDNAMRVLPMLDRIDRSVKRRMHFKGFQVDGTRYPHTHGDFDEFPYWNPKFWDPNFTDPLPRIR